MDILYVDGSDWSCLLSLLTLIDTMLPHPDARTHCLPTGMEGSPSPQKSQPVLGMPAQSPRDKRQIGLSEHLIGTLLREWKGTLQVTLRLLSLLLQSQAERNSSWP